MKLKGQVIKLFIIESLKKLKTAELSNWVGKAYIGERKHSQVIQEISELKNATGLYLLLSHSDDETCLYIGEADDVANRINQHRQNKNKEWWESFVIFISKDLNLTKAHVRYLEKELYLLAKENLTTIKLDNATSPPGSNLPDCDIADMDIFLENMIFVLNNLGIIDFAKVSQEEEVKQTTKNTLYLQLSQDRKDSNGNVLTAKMITKADGYVLLKDSYVESKERNSFKKHNYYSLRKKLEDEGYFEISDIKDVLKTKEDIFFKSPSAAAAVVKNRATNGRSEWKLSNGTSLDDFESKN